MPLVDLTVNILRGTILRDSSSGLGGRLAAYKIADMGTLEGPAVQILGMNEKGKAVGTAWPNGSPFNVAVLCRAGSMETINPPGAVSSVAAAINDAGIVVGGYWKEFAGEARAFRYDSTTKKHTDITPLVGTGVKTALAFDINNDGHIVGRATFPAGPKAGSAFYLNTATGKSSNLGTLGSNPHGYSQSCAFAMNNLGKAVGFSEGDEMLPFIAKEGGMEPLQGIEQGAAVDINDNDSILLGWTGNGPGLLSNGDFVSLPAKFSPLALNDLDTVVG